MTDDTDTTDDATEELCDNCEDRDAEGWVGGYRFCKACAEAYEDGRTTGKQTARGGSLFRSSTHEDLTVYAVVVGLLVTAYHLKHIRKSVKRLAEQGSVARRPW